MSAIICDRQMGKFPKVSECGGRVDAICASLFSLRDRVPNPHKNEPQATVGQNTGESSCNPVEGILAGVPMLGWSHEDAIGSGRSLGQNQAK